MSLYSSCKALIIGISKYADPKHNLTYARTDAEAMAELLEKEFGFDEIWTLYDADATRENIDSHFRDIQQTDRNDGILIFFAGHGFTHRTDHGKDIGYLLPYDGNPKQLDKNLSLEIIRIAFLQHIRAKHVFMIVDACYSGLALRDVTTVKPLPPDGDRGIIALTKHKVVQVLAAGTKDQQVLDDGLFGHSVFTGRLIEALLEADPYITADHIGVHVRERVAHDADERDHEQTPQFGLLFGTNKSSFIFKKQIKRNGPPDTQKYLEKAELLIKAGKYEEAIEAAKKGLKIDPLSYDLIKILHDAESKKLEADKIKDQEKQDRICRDIVSRLNDAERFWADGNIDYAGKCVKKASGIFANVDPGAKPYILKSVIETGVFGDDIVLLDENLDDHAVELPEQITFEDPELDKAIREIINKPTGIIYDYKLPTEFKFSGAGISTFEGIQRLKHLEKLVIFYPEAMDFNPISKLTNLVHLDLNAIECFDIEWLSNLRNLTELHLTGDKFFNIKPISNLVNLSTLWLGGWAIHDIRPVSNIKNLEKLTIWYSRVSDFTPIADLTNLRELEIANVNINNIEFVSGLEHLTYLFLHGFIVDDIRPIADLNKLTCLDIVCPASYDISPISDLENLTELYLNAKHLTSINFLTNLQKLKILHLKCREISDISPITSLTNLTELWVSGKKISDIRPISNLTGLTELELTNCDISDISPLINLKNLKHLEIAGNPLNSNSKNIIIPELIKKGVSVIDQEPIPPT